MFIVVSLCVGYRVGFLQERGSSDIAALPPSQIGKAQRDLNYSGVAPSPGHRKNEQPADKARKPRQQLQTSVLEAAQLKQQLNSLEGELAARTSALDRNAQDRAELERQLSLAQTNTQNLQDKLDVTLSQSFQGNAQSTALQAQVSDLTAAMREKDQQIAQHEELLEHDRDIRNLIGARDLYIAEIYDVAKSGKTQKLSAECSIRREGRWSFMPTTLISSWA